MHWAVPYVGLKYERGARGPQSYDCWGLLWKVYQDRFNIDLPEYPGIVSKSTQVRCQTITRDIEENWEESESFDGAGVALSQGKAFHHVGVWVEADGGKILHAWEGLGVIASRWKDLKLRGFRVIKFYRHKKWPTS